MQVNNLDHELLISTNSKIMVGALTDLSLVIAKHMTKHVLPGPDEDPEKAMVYANLLNVMSDVCAKFHILGEAARTFNPESGNSVYDFETEEKDDDETPRN